MRFLDTNILLRYFTKDDEKKANDVLRLLKKVEKAEEKVLTSPLVIFETIFTLETYYKVKRKEIKSLLSSVLNLRGLKLDFKDVFELALELYSEKGISFADAFNFFFMKKNGIKEIYSFDEEFDKLKEIKRVIP